MHEPAHDAFEQHVRKALDQYEVPYNSADWVQMEKSLNAGSVGSGRSRWGLAALLAGGLLIGGGAFWYLNERQEVPSGGLAQQDEPVTTSPELTVPTAAAQPAGTTTGSTEVTADENKNEKGTSTAGDLGHEANNASVTPAPGSTAPITATTASKGSGTADRSGRKESQAGKSPVQPAAPTDLVTTAGEKEQRTFRASVSQACAGTSVDFKVEHMPESGIYLWNFGDGSFSNKANPQHTFTKPGRYQVMLSMSSTGGGFIQNKPSSDVIVIHEAPKAAFNLVRQEYDGHLPSIHFENRSLGGVKYHWDFGDGQSSDIPHPDHIYKNQGTYQVELTVTNPIGCEDKVMKEVRIAKDYNLDAPVSFSPNGDGKEETFMPAALQKLGVKFTLSVYDLSGNLMYETKDASLPWAGKPQNRGDLCQAGEYVWVVDVRESLHLAETYTGKVKLVR